MCNMNYVKVRMDGESTEGCFTGAKDKGRLFLYSASQIITNNQSD